MKSHCCPHKDTLYHTCTKKNRRAPCAQSCREAEGEHTTGMDLHALTELGVVAGFILVPAASEPTLHPSHPPVELLGHAIQMARVWVLLRHTRTTDKKLRLADTYTYTETISDRINSKDKKQQVA